jgi:hypothetical protein
MLPESVFTAPLTPTLASDNLSDTEKELVSVRYSRFHTWFSII